MKTKVSDLTLDQLLYNFGRESRLFVASQADSHRARLLELLEAKRQELGFDRKKILEFCFDVIQRCPLILNRPPGFEWIVNEFRDALDLRLMASELEARAGQYGGICYGLDEEVFREALHDAMVQFSKRKPRNLRRNQKIAEEVEREMNVRGNPKNFAVDKVAERGLQGENGFSLSSERSVYRAIKQVEEYRKTRRPSDPVLLLEPGDRLIEIDIERGQGKETRATGEVKKLQVSDSGWDYL